MLIIITDDILKDFSNDLLPANENNLLEQIISSHLMGFHFVYGSERALKYLSISPKLSQSTKTIYTYIYNNRSTFEPNIIKLQRKIIISKEVQTILFKRDGIYINLSHLSKLNILEKFKLISEDIDDCTFYFSIADKLIKKESKLIQLAYDPINGGGDRTRRNFFDRAVSHKNISYTILDSDKKFQNDVEGETCRKVIRLYNRYKNNIVSSIYVLDVHEKENLIPSIIYSCFNGDKGVSTVLSEISRIPELLHYLKFLDLKEGLHSANYNPYYDDLIKYLFENNFVGESYSTFENSLEDFYEKLTQEELLSKREKEKIKEYIIRPLSTNPLEEFDLRNIIEGYMKKIDITEDPNFKLKYSKELGIFLNFRNNLLYFQKYELEKISKDIYEYSFAYNKHFLI